MSITELTVQQVINSVEEEVDDIIDESLLLDWIDRAISEIAIFWGEPKSIMIEEEGEEPVTPGEWYSLPDDFIKESEIFDHKGKRCHSHIISSQKEIRFKVSRKYKLNYHSKPAPIDREANLEEKVLPVNSLFHPAIILWCKAEYWDLESDSDQIESAHATKFRRMFYERVAETSRILNEEQIRMPREKRRLQRRLGRERALPPVEQPPQ